MNDDLKSATAAVRKSMEEVRSLLDNPALLAALPPALRNELESDLAKAEANLEFIEKRTP